MTRYEKALLFCKNKHNGIGHMRKYVENVPYYTHCIEVAEIVRTSPLATEDMLIAALLHDTVEDTGTTIEEIESNFGSHVAYLVSGLTDVSKPSDGKREIRKALDREHLAKGNYEIHTIKYADLISNAKDIALRDPNFAIVFFKEADLLLRVMDKGCPKLKSEIESILAKGVN